jgi:hypothetical protein
MSPPLSRRTFLKIGAAALAGLALKPLPWLEAPEGTDLPEHPKPVGKGRVTIDTVSVYQEPNFKSERIGLLRRDKIVNLYEVIYSPNGPKHNPRWYRVQAGFAHSAYLQRVEVIYNRPLSWIPEAGRLGEITVPYSISYRRTRQGWEPLYRLYYTSVYWITSLEEGPDGTVWYGLTDDLLHVQYCVPAKHVRPVTPEELTPISPGVPASDKRIEVSLSQQTLTAYEGDQVVLRTKVSTGIPSGGPPPNGIPTETPDGHFHIEVKVPSRHMGDGRLTSDLGAYELPGVPWVSFFHETGVGFHGTYWHDNFGARMSHGCVNMRNEDAKWLYRWANPVAEYQDWNRKGHGTYVRVA